MAKNFVVGIDIGGQSSKLGVVDARGEVLAQNVIPASAGMMNSTPSV